MCLQCLDFLSQQIGLPVPKLNKLIALNVDLQFVLLKLDHRVAKYLNGGHLCLVAFPMSASGHSSEASWQIFEPRGNLLLELPDLQLPDLYKRRPLVS